MHAYESRENHWEQLTARVASGERQAVQEFRSEFIVAVRRIVRRALRVGRRATGTGRRVAAVAAAMSPRRWASLADDDRQVLIEQVAHGLCDRLIARLRPDTTGSYRAPDTVVS